MPLQLAILASGSGTNAQAMIDKARSGLLDVKICLIASNNPKAQVLERAKNAGIPYIALDHKAYASRDAFDQDMADHVLRSGAEAVALAGYMRLLSKTFLTAFRGPILNLHPALLPSFPGLHGGDDAMQYGVKISGATVHFVDEKMDNGPVIIQAAVPVNPGESTDDLMTRIHAMEHRIYPQAIEWLAEKRLSTQGRKVYLKEGNARRQPVDGDFFVWPPLEEGF